MKKKKFIITMDTEGDNLWSWKQGDVIRTENTLYLQRFQDLCNCYGFKPVWLSNYEMLSDSRYVDFVSQVEQSGTGELGMHLHAWSTPPEHKLPMAQSGAPYLIEYPVDVMEEKISVLTSLIKERTGVSPVSHRSGRWAMNREYFDLLIQYGYRVDCSVTPHISWKNNPGMSKGSMGSDYSDCPEYPYEVEATNKSGTILEVPMSIRTMRGLVFENTSSFRNIASAFKNINREKKIWFRPNGGNDGAMMRLHRQILNEDVDYLMFMLHSSELMPGGSPTFKTEDDIERLYRSLVKLFEKLSQYYVGSTLREYENELFQERI